MRTGERRHREASGSWAKPIAKRHLAFRADLPELMGCEVVVVAGGTPIVLRGTTIGVLDLAACRRDRRCARRARTTRRHDDPIPYRGSRPL